MSRIGLTEKRENHRDVTCWIERLASAAAAAIQRDVQFSVVTTIQGVDSVSNEFAISILKRGTKLRHGREAGIKVSRSCRCEWASEGRKRNAALPPNLLRQRGASFLPPFP
jgi:hypothetical protein